MPWDVHLFSSVALLVLLQSPEINGVSQESVNVIECIRDMIPTQIYNDCCMRENNCTVTRQQNKGIDCMSRMIMSNYSYVFSYSQEGSSATTEMPHQYNNRNYQWNGDILEMLSEICRRQPKSRLQACIRNELIKRCRYSMLLDRVTSPPGRWNQRQDDGGYGNPYYRDRDGMEPRRGLFGSRSNQDNSGYGHGSFPDYGDSRPFSRGYHDKDEEDFGYSEGDFSKRRFGFLILLF